MEPVKIDVHDAYHVLYHFSEGTFRPGRFTEALLEAMNIADSGNFAKLAGAFPSLAEAFRIAKDTVDGIDRLKAITEEVYLP